jgi:hypothetical protein
MQRSSRVGTPPLIADVSRHTKEHGSVWFEALAVSRSALDVRLMHNAATCLR